MPASVKPEPLDLGTGSDIDVNLTWAQLGRWLLADMGAHARAFDRDYVQFDVLGAHRPKRRIIVQLNPRDEYNLMIGYFDRRSLAWKPLAVEHDVHVSILRERVRSLYREHA
ncbi:hypothetical protein [Amycolatopsis anabasis]|uniref:hypothetical protein n=1 Tax=Amycolatopsis anabasis TaxID=1840409 RepID=UPI00131CB927|nr:hypothetical protein [Amycolatopsis anabasis]